MANIDVDKIYFNGNYAFNEILRILFEFYGYEEIKRWLFKS